MFYAEMDRTREALSQIATGVIEELADIISLVSRYLSDTILHSLPSTGSPIR